MGVVLHVGVVGGADAQLQRTLEGTHEFLNFMVGAAALRLVLLEFVAAGTVAVLLAVLNNWLAYVVLGVVLAGRVHLPSQHLIAGNGPVLLLHDELQAIFDDFELHVAAVG